ncbi:hypothetical protein [Nitrosomonas marina]|uniref:Uncharacterized protein n=1 Tax=Nitrosomonas marina TaxID=917 RepID=A0A1H8ANR3_9PROT|nr:hypothetical protein [Nitrosomonas marina]SEM71624.1 hypothetical protein SAMN05216325_101220 [Nitrosomonas marina]
MNERMLTIEKMNLKLPRGFEKRADAIAREVARQLARMPLTQSYEYKTLMIPGVVVFNGETDQVIAGRIAQSIHRQLHTPVQSKQSGLYSQDTERFSAQNADNPSMEKKRGID